MRVDIAPGSAGCLQEAFPLSGLPVCVLHVGTLWASFSLSFAPLTSAWTPNPVHCPPNTQSSSALAKLSLWKSFFSLLAEETGAFTPPDVGLWCGKESEIYEGWKQIKWKESRCTNSDLPLGRDSSAFPS